MPLEWRYSYSGTDNGEPNESLGGSMSTTTLNATPMNNLFDNVSYDEATSGDSEYRCMILYANGGDYTDVSVYMSTETSSSDTQLDMAHEGIVATPPGTVIVDESTAPDVTGWTDGTFTHRTTASKLLLGNVGAINNGQMCFVWFKRVVAPGAASTSSDLGTISVEYIQT